MLKKLFYAFAWICLMASPAYAGTLSVACAANFTSAMKELASMYEKETGMQVNCTFGSTGMLYGQITKGAPYDLFFAADEKRPALLHEQGLAEAPVPYAKGRAVLWSRKAALFDMPNWKEALLSDAVVKVGIANPKTAPYGASALHVMKQDGLLARIKPKLAYGKSVGVSFQYAYSGAADVSFIALSQAISEKGSEGHHWPIAEAQVIPQAACVLSKGKSSAAHAFMEWMQSAKVRTMIKGYGYE